jgi:putative ABC transport system permease protein
MVLFSALIGFAAGYTVIQVIFRIFMMRMDGWFSFYLSPSGGVLAILFVILGYALVTAIDFHRIKRIPLDEALKNVE